MCIVEYISKEDRPSAGYKHLFFLQRNSEKPAFGRMQVVSFGTKIVERPAFGRIQTFNFCTKAHKIFFWECDKALLFFILGLFLRGEKALLFLILGLFFGGEKALLFMILGPLFFRHSGFGQNFEFLIFGKNFFLTTSLLYYSDKM